MHTAVYAASWRHVRLRLSATVEAQIRNGSNFRDYLPPLPPPPLPLPLPLPDAPPELPPELELELPELLEPLLPLESLFAAPSLESPPRSDPLCSVDEPAELDLVPVWVQPESPKAMLKDKINAAPICDSLFMLCFLPSCYYSPRPLRSHLFGRNPCAINNLSEPNIELTGNCIFLSVLSVGWRRGFLRWFVGHTFFFA
jgi:hypothetical protein